MIAPAYGLRSGVKRGNGSLTISIGNRDWTFTNYIAEHRESILNMSLQEAEPKKPKKPKKPKRSKRGQAQEEVPTGEPGEGQGEAREEPAGRQADEYDVEAIVGKKTRAGVVLYRVRWEGYGPDEDTWEPSASLNGCAALVAEYEEQQ